LDILFKLLLLVVVRVGEALLLLLALAEVRIRVWIWIVQVEILLLLPLLLPLEPSMTAVLRRCHYVADSMMKRRGKTNFRELTANSARGDAMSRPGRSGGGQVE